MIPIRPLAVALALALGSAPVFAGSVACQLDPRAAPSTPILFKGVVRGAANPAEVAEQTQIAVMRVRAPESPAYVKMPRVFAFYFANGVRHGTIAAVTGGDMPTPGEAVTLVSRHRDLAIPCGFVPWIVQGGPVAIVPRRPSRDRSDALHVPVHRNGNSYFVAVTLNGQVTVDFLIDSGASLVQIPERLVKALRQRGTLGSDDVVGQATVKIADGSTHLQSIVRLHSVTVGGKTLANVAAVSGGANASPLLGMSFLGRFKSWSIDNAGSALVLK